MIYTFYSYKGGVGRSMALANLAHWFYLKGLRVVIVDWDLEAPGLENFFYESPEEVERVRKGLGLIDLLAAYKREYPYLSRVEETAATTSATGGTATKEGDSGIPVARDLDDAAFLKRLQALPPLADTWIQIKPEPNVKDAPTPSDKRVLRLVSAGWRAGDRFSDYAREVQNFNWSDFYQSYRGKVYFEWFRNQLMSDNDVVLIDSRTGVTEMSGVCTQDLADVVVSLCVPNVQNLTGVAQMSRAFVREELKAAREPRPLPAIAVVPTRIENSESDLRARFKDEFFITLRELKGTDQGRGIDPDSAWRMRIPYIPKYAYAEKLAIGAEDGNEDLIEAYNRVGAYLLTLAFSDEHWVARTERSLQERLRVIVEPALANVRPRSGAYLSYSPRDGSEFAERLVRLLQQHDIDAFWQDPIGRLASGTDFPAAIPSAISQSAFMLLVVTKNALQSKYAREEWRQARHQGVCVYAIKGSSDIDSIPMPRWLRRAHLYDIGLGDDIGNGIHWKRLTKEMSGLCRAPRVPFTVDKLPDGFVRRPAELEQVVANLIDGESLEPAPGVVALRGPAGCGKSLIAAAACHDSRVQDAFEDGIIWISLGQSTSDVTARLEDLIHLLGAETPRSATVESAGYQLADLLSDRRMLIAIDDVWSPAQIRPFLQGGSNCTRLITTRNFDAVPSGARTISLGRMNPSEAVAVLSSGLPAAEQKSLDALIERVGESPLALNMLNRALRHRVYETNQTVDDALSYVSSALDKRGPSFFDSRDDADQNTISKALSASLDLLSDGERARFLELAVFPAAADIPTTTVARLWRRTGQLDEFDTDELCSRFNRLSLLDSFDAGKHQIRLHRLMREYLLEGQRESVTELHRRLLEAHRPPADSVKSRAGFTTNEDGWAALPDEEPYLWDHLAFHLLGAGLGSELVATVLSLPYLAVKTRLRGTASVEKDLLAAERHRPDYPMLNSLRKRFIQVAHILRRCNDLGEIASTLFSRLSDLEELDPITLYLEARLPMPYLAPLHFLPDVPAPNLVRVLAGHFNRVNGCVFGPDGGVVVSASDDHTVKIWDTETGVEIATLKDPSDGVNACAVSPDGSFIVSGSSDSILRVWDRASRTERLALTGHTGAVLDCAILPDGLKIVSASADGSLRIWDAVTGNELRTLVGHEKAVNACVVSADGTLILSSSEDGTLKVWDASTGELVVSTEPRGSANDCAIDPTATLLISASADPNLKTWSFQREERLAVQQGTLRGHTGRINCCEIASDGSFIVSGATDHLVKVWDAKVRRERSTLRGHTAWVNDCAISCDDKTVVSASNDRSLRLWNSTVAADPAVFSKHTLWTRSCAISADGSRLVTGSDDRNVRVWNTETGAEVSTLVGHKGWVKGCAISRDGSVIVSASSDGTLGIWDAHTGNRKETRLSPGQVNSCAITRDGARIVSANALGFVSVWDAETGQFERAFEHHGGEVNRCAIDPESRYVLSASSDKTLKVWELSSGKLQHSIPAHTGAVNDCAISEDGSFAVSASSDCTLKVWDTSSWAIRSEFSDGLTDSVTGCAINSEGTMIASVSRDGTLRIWGARRGECLATFYSDGGLFGCVWFPDGKHIAAVGAAGGVYFVRFERESNSSSVEPALELNMRIKTPS